MLDAVVEYLPAPDRSKSDRRFWKMARPLIPVRPMTTHRSLRLAFKIATDPFVGSLTFYPRVLR